MDGSRVSDLTEVREVVHEEVREMERVPVRGLRVTVRVRDAQGNESLAAVVVPTGMPLRKATDHAVRSHLRVHAAATELAAKVVKAEPVYDEVVQRRLAVRDAQGDGGTYFWSGQVDDACPEPEQVAREAYLRSLDEREMTEPVLNLRLEAERSVRERERAQRGLPEIDPVQREREHDEFEAEFERRRAERDAEFAAYLERKREEREAKERERVEAARRRHEEVR